MSKIRLSGSNSGYVEIAAAADAGNLTFTMPTTGTALFGNGNNVISGITTFNAALDINSTVDVSGTSVFNNDVTFDGVTSGYDVVWDRSDNALEFAANAKATFGNSQDMQLFHDGNHGYINDAGTGNLRLRSGTLEIQNLAGSKTSAVFSSGGGQTLNFNNNAKFVTTNTGAVVTGICTATSFSGSGEGLTRTTQLSHRNLIQNGNFAIFQRFLPGSQVTCNNGTNFYCMDRWYARGEGSKAVFKLIQQDITSEGQGAHAAARVQVTTASGTPATNDVYKIAQRIEGRNVQHLSWGTSGAKTITLSFLVKSSVTGTYGGSIMNSAQNRAYPFTYAISSANTWEQKSITIPGDQGGTWLTNTGIGLELNFDMGTAESNYRRPAGSWYGNRAEGADGTVQLVQTNGANWYVTKVQIEEGSYSTPFEHISYQENLSQCKRYYETMGRGASQYMGNGWFFTNSAFYSVIRWEVEKRVTPSIDQNTGSNYFIVWREGGNVQVSGFTGLSWQNLRAAAFYFTASGTTGASGGLGCNNAEAFFAVSADL